MTATVRAWFLSLIAEFMPIFTRAQGILETLQPCADPEGAAEKYGLGASEAHH
jgi:hypothetical protein